MNSREFINAQGQKIRLEANGLTPVRFYMITKKDLIDTIREVYFNELQQAEKLGKYINSTPEQFAKFTEKQRSEMYEVYKNLKHGNTQFYYDFTAALIMSADRNLKDYESVLQMIPSSWLKQDSAEARGISELMLSYIVDLDGMQKKK